MTRFHAELVLVAWALVFSTGAYYPAAAFGIAAGLFLSSRWEWRSEIAHLYVALVAGAVLSLFGSGSFGPAVHAGAMILGAIAWSVVGGVAPSPRRLALGLHEPGRVSLVAALLLATCCLGERIVRNQPPVLWMVSPIDCGMVLLVLGLQGFAALAKETHRLFLVALLGLMMAFSTSRGLLLAWGVGAVLLFPGRRRALTVPIALLALVAVPLVWARIAADPLAWGRSRIWAGATELLMLHPWIGWGLGDFANASRLDLMPDPIAIRHMLHPVHAHNDALQLAVEIGLPLAAWSVAGFLAVVLCRRRQMPRESLAVLAALAMLSLVYFPFQIGWPLACAAWHLGRVFPAPAPRTPGGWRQGLLGVSAAAVLLYAVGLAAGWPSIARWDARTALTDQGADGVYRLLELERARPEAWVNVAHLAARHGSRGGAVRGFQAAVNRAPAEMPLRLELARAWLWYAAEPSLDTPARLAAHRQAEQNLGWIRAVEPLALAGAASLGDRIAFWHARVELERLERRGVPAHHLLALRRPSAVD